MEVAINLGSYQSSVFSAPIERVRIRDSCNQIRARVKFKSSWAAGLRRMRDVTLLLSRHQNTLGSAGGWRPCDFRQPGTRPYHFPVTVSDFQATISQMPRVQRINPPSGFRSPPSRRTSSSWCAPKRMHLFGWDSRSETWHGPNELACTLPDGRLLKALRSAPAKSWYGTVNCCTLGGPPARFFALIHDLSDCAIAVIYCDESKAGPAEILAVIPAERRTHLRDEFAFEFLAFARFLGSLSPGADLKVHDALASAIADRRRSEGFILSISSGLWPSDLDIVLSACVEKVAVTLCQWIDEDSTSSRATRRGSFSAA